MKKRRRDELTGRLGEGETGRRGDRANRRWDDGAMGRWGEIEYFYPELKIDEVKGLHINSPG